MVRSQVITQPPLTSKQTPLTKEASSDAKKTTVAAASSAVPRRPTGVASTTRFNKDSSESDCSTAIGVAIAPGATALVVIPYGPKFRAKFFVTAIKPALVAAYTQDCEIPPVRAPTLDIFTIRPHLRSFIPFEAATERTKGARKFVETISSN